MPPKKNGSIWMRNHPSPAPTEIKAWRISVGLTQAQAAVLIGYTAHSWENWEQGVRPMRPILFDLARRSVQQPDATTFGTSES